MSTKKSVKDYEREAHRVGKCLEHAAHGIARKVYQMRHGQLPSSKILVCHICDNPPCILDAHHFIGTCADNMQDAKRKGRLKKTPEKLAYMRKIMSRPETRERLRLKAVQRWSDKTARNKASITQKDLWNKPERKLQRSAATSMHYRCAGARDVASKAALKRWADEEEHKRASTAQLVAWKLQGRHEQASVKALRRCEGPEAKMRMVNAAYKGWITRRSNLTEKAVEAA